MKVTIQIYNQDKYLIDALSEKFNLPKEQIIHIAIESLANLIILMPTIERSLGILKGGK